VTIYAVLGRRRPPSERFADRFILFCGLIFPTSVLAALLVFGLRLLPGARGVEDPDLVVHVEGEQFWWRVTYETPEGMRVETANHIRLPLGQKVELHLTAHDVIHSFWIPPLGGKLDMIPGRTNILRLVADQAGRFRGVCTEFCGVSHALMAFEVEVAAPEDVEAWLKAEAAPVRAPSGRAEAGLAVFREAGC